MSRDVIAVAHSSNTVTCARDSFSESVMTAAGTVPILTVSWHTGRGGGGGGGDAPHRPSTQNATRVKKKGGGSKLYIFPNFDEK